MAAFLINSLAASVQIAGTVITQSTSSLVIRSMICLLPTFTMSLTRKSMHKENTVRAERGLPISSSIVKSKERFYKMHKWPALQASSLSLKKKQQQHSVLFAKFSQRHLTYSHFLK